MKTNKIALGVVTLVVAGLALYYFRKKEVLDDQRLGQIADAGYETAHDILYPLRKNRWRNS
jgi:uncharacterized membrane protein